MLLARWWVVVVVMMMVIDFHSWDHEGENAEDGGDDEEDDHKSPCLGLLLFGVAG